jgi:uncharacterized protein YdiU (UPF0061 family)
MTKNTNKKTDAKTELNYSFYSKVLNKPFDSLTELAAAETAYYDEVKTKEDKAAQKKADAKKVEDAFKALNQARRTYKDTLVNLTNMYQQDLKTLKENFDADRTRVQLALADAENAYSTALKTFTEKYETYHLSLKDGDFETTISGTHTADKAVKTTKPGPYSTLDLLEALFGV